MATTANDDIAGVDVDDRSTGSGCRRGVGAGAWRPQGHATSAPS